MSLRFKILLIFFFLASYAMGQTPIPRGSAAVTVQDANLHVMRNFKIPTAVDTAHALLGLDSLGLLVFIRSTGEVYKRDTVPGGHKWTLVGSTTGGGGSADSLKHRFVDTGLVARNNYILAYDSTNRKWILLTRNFYDSVLMVSTYRWDTAKIDLRNEIAAAGAPQTLSYTQGPVSNTIGISGGNSQFFLPATLNLSGLEDTTTARWIDSARRGLLADTTIYRSSGVSGNPKFYLTISGKKIIITFPKDRDSLDFHSALSPDSARASWVQAHDTVSINALASKYGLDTTRTRINNDLAGKMNNYGGAPGQLQGTFAGLPAATSYLAGTTYIAQDSGFHYVDTGSGGSRGWKRIAGGSGGGSSTTLAKKAIAFGDASNLVTGDTSKIKHDSSTNGHTYLNVNNDGYTGRYVSYFYGNSETIGFGLTNPRDAYPFIASPHIGDSAVNLAVSGRTLRNTGWAGASGFILGDTASIPTYGATSHLLYNAIGVNDVRAMVAGSDSAAFRTAYRLWVIAAMRKGWPAQAIVLISPFYVPDFTYKADSAFYSFTPRATQARSIGFGVSVQAVVAEFGLKYVDGYSAIYNNGADQLIQSDSLHMNLFGDKAVAAAVLGVVDTVRLRNQRLAVDGLVSITDVRIHRAPVVSDRDNTEVLGRDSTNRIGPVLNASFNKVMVGGTKYADEALSALLVKGRTLTTAFYANGYIPVPTTGAGIHISNYLTGNNSFITSHNWGTGANTNLSIQGYGGETAIGGLAFKGDGSLLSSSGLANFGGLFVSGNVGPTIGAGVTVKYNANAGYVYATDVGVAAKPLYVGYGGSPVIIQGSTNDGVHGFQVNTNAKFNNPIGIQVNSSATAYMSFAGATTLISPIRFTPAAPPSAIVHGNLNFNSGWTITDSVGKRDTLVRFADLRLYPFPTGISSLNGLTGATQTFTTGTTGTDFGISSSGTTHTFNMPDANGTTARGLVSTGTQTFGGTKTLASPKLPSLATATSNYAFVVVDSTDGTTKRVAPVIANIYAANGNTKSATGDTINQGGTYNQDTYIAGAGKSKYEGTNASNLDSFAVYAGTVFFNKVPVVNGAPAVISYTGNDLYGQTNSVFGGTNAPVDGVYEVSGWMLINSISSTTLKMQVTFNDHNNTTQTIDLFPNGATTVLNGATGYYIYPSFSFRAKAGVSFGVNVIKAGATSNYDFGWTIKQLR